MTQAHSRRVARFVERTRSRYRCPLSREGSRERPARAPQQQENAPDAQRAPTGYRGSPRSPPRSRYCSLSVVSLNGIVDRPYEGSGRPLSSHIRRLSSRSSSRRSSAVPATRPSPASSLPSGTTRAVIRLRSVPIQGNLMTCTYAETRAGKRLSKGGSPGRPSSRRGNQFAPWWLPADRDTDSALPSAV